MEGQHGRIRCFAVGLVYPSKSLTMCSSDFVFRKYKQDSAFRVSGVLQLAKTGPPVMKNFPLLRLFPSDATMGWRLYTPYDVNRTNLHILTARGMSHILTRIGQLWSSRKNSYTLFPGFSNLAGARRKSLGTSSICVGYFSLTTQFCFTNRDLIFARK